MTTLYTNFLYHTEVSDVVKLFCSDVVLCDTQNADIVLLESDTNGVSAYSASFGEKNVIKTVKINAVDELQAIRLRKRYAKIAVYELLTDVFGKKMPWGSLTGIRPTKLARQIQSEGLNWQDTFQNLLGVSPQKTKLVRDILLTQGDLFYSASNGADLYVGIPFCVSRCSYCSFTSGEIERLKKYVEPYVDALCRDIDQTVRFANEKGIAIGNVYFGGGTPTSLSAEQLDRILSRITFKPKEFTVEAGRPDTVSKDKLDVFAEHGVGRISVNPQTFNQSVLDAIGRKHTVQDIYDKYELAKQYGFTVNMDLIAGLPTETPEMFKYSVDSAIELSPQNITVHTLALKKGSVLKEQSYSAQEQSVCQMVEYSHQALYDNGYLPYYMYRQKYVMDNLENVGFCKPGTQCLYNIGIMEEISSILACGTNAISKRVLPLQNRIERAANAKDVITYIERNDDYLQKKFRLFGDDK